MGCADSSFFSFSMIRLTASNGVGSGSPVSSFGDNPFSRDSPFIPDFRSSLCFFRSRMGPLLHPPVRAQSKTASRPTRTPRPSADRERGSIIKSNDTTIPFSFQAVFHIFRRFFDFVPPNSGNPAGVRGEYGCPSPRRPRPDDFLERRDARLPAPVQNPRKTS